MATRDTCRSEPIGSQIHVKDDQVCRIADPWHAISLRAAGLGDNVIVSQSVKYFMGPEFFPLVDVQVHSVAQYDK